MRRALPFEAFLAAARRAAQAIQAQPRSAHWLVACDTDADGLCAAAVMAQALRRDGRRYTVRASRNKDAAAYEELFAGPFDALLLLDKGTSHVAQLAAASERTGRPVVIVDHHNVEGPIPSSVSLVNPRAAGLDGSRDASAATSAVAVAMALCGDEAALPWAPIGLSGAIGDWQHVPDWKGWNLHVLDRARAAGHVRDVPQPLFIGVTLAEALARRQPPLPGLEGDVPAAEAFLHQLAIAPGAEAEDLDGESATRLVSALGLRLLAAGRRDDLDGLVAPVEQNVRLGTSLRHVFRIVDACGREGEPATGLAYLLGDGAARTQALATFARYKAALQDGLETLRRDGTQGRAAIQVAWTANPDYTGMVAGLGMEHVVPDRSRPIAVLAKRPDGLVQVSTRGQERLVKAGLNLGRACKEAAAAIGAEGGGHPVAAGAVVPHDRVDGFLSALDVVLAGQGFRGAP